MPPAAPSRRATAPGRQVTLDEVAGRAGVSTASVSRVLNHPHKVSAALRQRVLAVVGELGYVPNGLARGLASRRSRTIGAIVPTLGVAIFASGVQALQARLHEHGYTLLVASAEYDPEKELLETRTLIERGVDGLALVGARHLPAIHELLERHRVPYVNTYAFAPDDGRPCIGFDNRAIAHRLTRYLIGLGHRRFGIITGPTRHNDRLAARLEGMLACLAEHGLAPPADQVVEVPYGLADGRRALGRLLALRRGITAVPCTNDVLAFGALAECLERGLRVPEALSITGIDDLDLAAHVHPPLTTVHVPTDMLGRAVADYLLGRIGGTAVAPHTELPVEIIVRGSTAAPAAAGRAAARLARA